MKIAIFAILLAILAVLLVANQQELVSAVTGEAESVSQAARDDRPRPPFELGEISSRPPAPLYPYEQFVRTSGIGDVDFSYDNKWLYFVQGDGHVNNIYAIDINNENIRQVTFSKEPIGKFRVAPNDRFLVAEQDIAGDESYALYRYDIAFGADAQLTPRDPHDASFGCGFGDSSRYFYYTQTANDRSEAGIYRVDTGNAKQQLLYREPGRYLHCSAVSGDEKYVAFLDFIENNEIHLGLLEVATGKTRTIVREAGVRNDYADFSAKRLLFRSNRDADIFRLWEYGLDSGELALSEELAGKNLERFVLQAGGRSLTARYRTELAAATIIRIDGSSPDTYLYPDDNIVDASFSHSDPRYGILTAGAATAPKRYYLLGPEGWVLLHDSNQSGISPEHFAMVKSSRLQSFDGVGIPVHLIIPNGTSAENPKPVLFWIHGGPEEHVDPEYDSRLQFFANRGFIVVAPNVRGSTGFGQRFALMDNGDWGGRHVRDIIETANQIRALDFVDSDHMYILGSSFGGFSVMSLITQYPDTFDAAIDFFGLTEMETFFTSMPDYAEAYLLAELGFDPRIDEARNREISPLYHVDQINIPLQIHQGANDPRVPQAQSDMLVEQLRKLNKPVEYFVYKNEGHGFTRLENSEMAYGRVVDFLNRQMDGDNAKR